LGEGISEVKRRTLALTVRFLKSVIEENSRSMHWNRESSVEFILDIPDPDAEILQGRRTETDERP